MNVPGLKKEDVESWQNALFSLDTLIIFRHPDHILFINVHILFNYEQIDVTPYNGHLTIAYFPFVRAVTPSINTTFYVG